MSARFTKGHSTPAKTAASTETALPVATSGLRPATLSGAFGAAIGGAPQLTSTGQSVPPASAGGARLKPDAPTPSTLKNSKPAAPTLPRKGHR